MNINKLKEALEDLQRQRDLIDKAMNGLRAVMVQLNGRGVTEQQAALPLGEFDEGVHIDPSATYLDIATKVIEANHWRPMHVKAILEHIRLIKGNPKIKRQSVEATFYRHIELKGDESRIVKVSPGMYGVRRFPREESAA